MNSRVVKKTPWLFLESGKGEAAFNMAMDEALLEALPRLRAPVFRSYGWSQPAATFGYFQKFSEVECATMLRPLIRRPTGGGLVPHDNDWTYSVAFPNGHDWFSLPAVESYRRVHEWIQSAFDLLSVQTELAPCCKKIPAGVGLPGQCFVGYEKYDLLWFGKKIAGAAQRRNKLGLLIQGSVQPPPGVERGDWQEKMLQSASKLFSTDWKRFECDQELIGRASLLAREKYARDEYNRKR